MITRAAATAVAALLVTSCATAPVHHDVLAARVDAELAKRGLEGDSLQLIDNLVRHEPGPPPAAPALVRELFAKPLAAADAASLFRRAVPAELLAFDGGKFVGANRLPNLDSVMPLAGFLAHDDGETVAETTTVGAGDEIAVLPPVSGG